MGFFDAIKKSLGGGGDEKPETVDGPSRVLRKAGIDPKGLSFQFGTDGTLGVSGSVPDEATRDRIVQVLSDMDNIKNVDESLVVAPVVAAETPAAPSESPLGSPEPETSGSAGGGSEPVVEEPATDDAGGAEPGETYTVQAGDSLWKIAAEIYGNGAHYTRIFEANRDQLDNPDLIHPGQVLKIPPKEG